MRLPIKFLSWGAVLVLLMTLSLAVVLVLDSRPLVPGDRTLTAAEVAWAKGWLRQARPRGLRDGARVTLALSELEANVLGSYLIDRIANGRVVVRLEDGQARLTASLGLPWDPQAHFLNLQVKLVSTPHLPRIAEARLAGLPLPAGLVETVTARLMDALDQSSLLQNVELAPGLALLTYQWRRHALEHLGSGLIAAEERTRVLDYQAELGRYGGMRSQEKRLVLSDLISHLMRVARARADADPAVENRAAILALAAYVNRRTIRDPVDPDAKSPVFRAVVLRGRRDLSRHFMTSAAVSAQGGNTLADLIGLFKEVSDANGGSGFSFADLAADRAGTRFAEMATGEPKSALALQELAQGGLTEDDIMPIIDGLPEGLSQAQFAAAFRDTKSEAYRRVTDHIERRIDGLALFQTLKQ